MKLTSPRRILLERVAFRNWRDRVTHDLYVENDCQFMPTRAQVFALTHKLKAWHRRSFTNNSKRMRRTARCIPFYRQARKALRGSGNASL